MVYFWKRAISFRPSQAMDGSSIESKLTPYHYAYLRAHRGINNTFVGKAARPALEANSRNRWLLPRLSWGWYIWYISRFGQILDWFPTQVAEYRLRNARLAAPLLGRFSGSIAYITTIRLCEDVQYELVACRNEFGRRTFGWPLFDLSQSSLDTQRATICTRLDIEAPTADVADILLCIYIVGKSRLLYRLSQYSLLAEHWPHSRAPL